MSNFIKQIHSKMYLNWLYKRIFLKIFSDEVGVRKTVICAFLLMALMCAQEAPLSLHGGPLPSGQKTLMMIKYATENKLL